MLAHLKLDLRSPKTLINLRYGTVTEGALFAVTNGLILSLFLGSLNIPIR